MLSIGNIDDFPEELAIIHVEYGMLAVFSLLKLHMSHIFEVLSSWVIEQLH